MNLGTWYYNGDRVKIDDVGQHFFGSVIKQDHPDEVWVLLDGGDNPIPYKPNELEPVPENRRAWRA